MKSPSIRRTLLLRCGFGVGILLCLLSTGTFLIVRHGLFRELDRSITQTAALLSNQVELENGAITFEWQEGLGTNRILRDEGLFQFWNEANGNTTRSPRLEGRDLPKFHDERGAPLLKDIRLPGSGRSARAIGMKIYPFVTPEQFEFMKSSGRILDPKSLPHILVVARDTKSIYRVLKRTGWVLGLGSVLTLGLGFLLIGRVIRVTLRPIDELTAQMRGRAGPRLDCALDLPSALPVELSGLAENFDALLARVSSIRQRESDFIRHASHELRTPIASLRATTELALSQDRTPREYREHLATCQGTVLELGELIKRLSALARIGMKGELHTFHNFDIVGKIDSCLEPFRGLFQERGLILITGTDSGQIPVTGDPSLTQIIFNNLFDNALCYNRPGGSIRIHARETADAVEIRVSNPTETPLGNPEQWFEPLFRKNPSREDAQSHLGIGLTLSQNAATAMGWTLHAEIPREAWIEFVLRIPRIGLEHPAA